CLRLVVAAALLEQLLPHRPGSPLEAARRELQEGGTEGARVICRGRRHGIGRWRGRLRLAGFHSLVCGGWHGIGRGRGRLRLAGSYRLVLRFPLVAFDSDSGPGALPGSDLDALVAWLQDHDAKDEQDHGPDAGTSTDQPRQGGLTALTGTWPLFLVPRRC